MLEIKRTPARLEIQIEDDGRGFDAEDWERRQAAGLGLALMREHARALGGAFLIRHNRRD
jgi:signal transduction histidine kinase